MRQEEPGRGAPIGPLNLAQVVPFEPSAVSDRLGWLGLKAIRYRAAPASDFTVPAITRHTLVLVTRPPEGLDPLYEGVKRHQPPPAGAVSLVPAGTPVQWHWGGHKDSFHIHLEPGLVARVAAEAFGLDPARLMLPPLDSLDLPRLRAAMLAVDAVAFKSIFNTGDKHERFHEQGRRQHGRQQRREDCQGIPPADDHG